MARDIPKLKVQAFLKRPSQWQDSYKKLREIILSCGLDENFKWKHPCYTLENNNVVLIHGFNDYCALLFIKGALMDDPKSLLIQQTKNVQERRQLRFESLDEINTKETVIKKYIKEAIRVEKSGEVFRLKETQDYDVPDELQVFFDSDTRFKEAFEKLTPGRQRGYLLYFSGAKQSATRTSRIEKYYDRIFEGIGYNEDYKLNKKKPRQKISALDIFYVCYLRSKRSASITFVHAEAKSSTNFC